MLIGKIDESKDIHNVESASEVIVVTELDKWEEAKDAYWQAVSERDYYKGKAEAYEKVLMMCMPMIVMKGKTE